MTFDSVGEADLRGENVTRAIKGFAQKLFKLKQVCIMQSSSNLTETYYTEANAILTAKGNRSIEGVARGALPPELTLTWEKTSADHIKFMGQDIIYWEDTIGDAIPIQARTILRVAESVANAVDAYIYAQLTAATGTSGTVASSDAWNSLTEQNRDPIGDGLIGISAIGSNNYDFRANGFWLMSELDYSSVLRNSKVINNPSFKTADVVSNGRVANLLSGKIIVTDSVTADESMLVVGQRTCTWKSAFPLTGYTRDDPGISTKIRAWEYGQLQITDPQGIYTITNTQV